MDSEDDAATELRVPRRGDRIGDYVVERELGRGAVSIVVLARERSGGRRVALRLINGHTYWTMDEEGRAHLEERVRGVAALAHPNLVRVDGCGRWRGWTFVVMEYVEGQTLGDWLAAHEPDWRRTTALFIGVAEGLAAAHDRGLLHCDLDPGAVLVAVDGDAKLRGLDVGQPPAGADGQLLGAWRTTSPERILGREFDHRSDQFGLCALLWYALCGQWPFTAPSVLSVFLRVLDGHIDAPVDAGRVPEGVLRVLRRGMATDPSQRWASAREVAAQLRLALR